MSIALTLHLLATVIWVGGMFFAHVAMRPVAAQLLAPPQRLPLLAGVFKRFFLWVWIAVIVLPVSGYWMVFAVLGGMGAVGIHIHIMSALGLVMIGLFVFLYLLPFRAMRAALTRDDFREAGRRLALIRGIVATNLVLGLTVTVIAVAGKFF
ncbi:CopD family protein [Endothiovibrio diazotrophicus]